MSVGQGVFFSGYKVAWVDHFDLGVSVIDGIA
jgi:hypothetical protein